MFIIVLLRLKFISEADIRLVLKNLTKNELTLDEQQKITEKIIEEGDIDNGEVDQRRSLDTRTDTSTETA